MNARQKAKHYKKLYERLRYQPVNFQVNTVKTSIIKACVLVPYEMAKTIEPCEIEEVEMIKTKLAREMANEIKEIMDISVIDYSPQCVYKVYGTLRVVERLY